MGIKEHNTIKCMQKESTHQSINSLCSLNYKRNLVVLLFKVLYIIIYFPKFLKFKLDKHLVIFQATSNELILNKIPCLESQVC